MENKKVTLSKKENKFYINLISERFLTNPRMLLLFNKEKNYFKKVKTLVEYCFYLASKLDGLYIAKNKKTIILFYEKKHFKQNVFDCLRYFKILLNIKPKKILEILKNEKKIKAKKLKIDNYLYIWFIAQEKNYVKLDGLIEVNKMIFNYSNKKNLPILLETSNKELLNLYKRANFKVYDTLIVENEIIYFLADKFTLESKQF